MLFTIYCSSDLNGWASIASGVPASAGNTTNYNVAPSTDTATKRKFYRIKLEL